MFDYKNSISGRCDMDNGVNEENLVLLAGRVKALSEDYGSYCELNMSDEMAIALAGLSPENVRLAASAVVPIFKLGVDPTVLERLVDGLMLDRSDVSNSVTEIRSKKRPILHELITFENEFILMNRWAAAREGGIRTKILYAMSDKMIRLLRSLNQTEVRTVARSGYVLAHLNARPGYFYQAQKCDHVVARQLDNLAIASTTLRI